MKIRIQGDSVRCRLGRQELGALLANGVLRASTRFPSGRLGFDLTLDGGLTAPAVDCVDGRVAMVLPRDAFVAWARGQEESYAFSVGLPDGRLEALIEKDFPCDTRPDCAGDPDLFTDDTLSVAF